MMYIHYCKNCNRIYMLNGHKLICPRCTEPLAELRISYLDSEQEMKSKIVSFFRSIKEKSSTTRVVSMDEIKSFKDISSWEERLSLRNTNPLAT